MPLQASTILLRADHRRAALDPPLPPISHDQVQPSELASLLTEEDYNLSTMVNLSFNLMICLKSYLLYNLQSFSTVFKFFNPDFSLCVWHLFLSVIGLWFGPTFSHGLLHTISNILHEIL